MITLEAKGVYFRELNMKIKEYVRNGEKEILLKNVEGQRYIGDGIQENCRIIIEGTPGNDMAAYMDGAEIIVHGNAQDAIANTMNSGRIVVHGNAGDTAGYGMRGGEVYIKGNVGYRVGIHMKEYSGKKPVLVIGGKAGDFLGEYMAGGVIILLGLNMEEGGEIVGNYCGTGMHGGTIYIRGNVETYKLSREVRQVEPDGEDMKLIGTYVKNFSEYFGYNYHDIMKGYFSKLYAYNKRPYGNLYAY